MSELASSPSDTPRPISEIPDPTKGLRAVYAAVLVLEAIVVGLALLVLPKFGVGATPLGVGLIGGLAVAMVLASGVQRRPWGLAVALALQVATIACGLLVPALALVGLTPRRSGRASCSWRATCVAGTRAASCPPRSRPATPPPEPGSTAGPPTARRRRVSHSRSPDPGAGRRRRRAVAP